LATVLVRVRAASVNPRDWHFLRGLPYVMRPSGLRIPKGGAFGSDLAGHVEAVGRAVTRFRPGDEVYAHVLAGAFAEQASVPEAALGPKPANLSFEQAAAVRVCSGGNADLVRSLGADHVTDYTREDFARGGRRYDLIFQLAGTRSPADCRRALTPKGTLLVSSGASDGRWIGPIGRILKAVALSPFVGQRLVPFEAKPSARDLETLTGLIEAGTVAPVIDRTCPLRETPAAIRYLEQGHARGKVVITVP
jgi:NADPH:quinone reductase-like Zn-dependent oxidoreductase